LLILRDSGGPLEGVKWSKANGAKMRYSFEQEPVATKGVAMDQPVAGSAATASPVGQLYTVEEVARFLRVSPRAVQVWIRGGSLPAVRYGRLLRIREADLANFGEVLEKHTPPADAPRGE
jgi:excisionase family DNA binding protein